MKAKCKKCGFKDDLSKFDQVLIIPGTSMDYGCPKCSTIGIMNGKLRFIDESNVKKIVGNALKKLRETFSKGEKI